MVALKSGIKRSYVIYLLLLVFLLVTVRWIWHEQLSFPDPPVVKQGVLDLRGMELAHSRPFPMNGTWQFYPGRWIGASDADSALQGQALQVPGNWNAALDPAGKKAYGFGTYHVRILLDRPLSEPLGLWFQSVYTDSEVEINGEVLAQFGVLAERKGMLPKPGPLRSPICRGVKPNWICSCGRPTMNRRCKAALFAPCSLDRRKMSTGCSSIRWGCS